MHKASVRRGRRKDSEAFIGLVKGLARFEKLEPPSPSGARRLLRDVFVTKKVHLFVAEEGDALVGYALYYYSYSSFLALPTLYLEDLYVQEGHRGRGVGFALFRRCVDEAMARGCGRMEWTVLTWNRNAQEFYEMLGARRLADWAGYRLDEKGLRDVPGTPPRA